MNKNEIEIEVNPIKVLIKSRRRVFSTTFWITWFLISLIIVFFFFLSIFKQSTVIYIKDFSISDFLAPSITGLSFTLALFVATTRIFSKENLVSLYMCTNDNKEEGFLFYETIAPYIWSGLIWLTMAISSLMSKMFSFDIPIITKNIIKLLFCLVALQGLMSLWYLLKTHIQDISLETERELKRKRNELEEEKELNNRLDRIANNELTKEIKGCISEIYFRDNSKHKEIKLILVNKDDHQEYEFILLESLHEEISFSSIMQGMKVSVYIFKNDFNNGNDKCFSSLSISEIRVTSGKVKNNLQESI